MPLRNGLNIGSGMAPYTFDPRKWMPWITTKRSFDA
jgi:hypothetical protein